MPDLRVSELKELLQQQCPGLLHELVPGLKREGARTFKAPNPTRNESKTGSFTVWMNGAWREYDEAEDVGKGDLLGLVAYVNGYAPKSTEGRRFAIGWAKERLGLGQASAEQLRRTRRDIEKNSQARRDAREAEESARRQRIFGRVLTVWGQAAESDDALMRYLGGRGIDLFAIRNRARSLRLHLALDHWAMPHQAAWRGPAMVARVVNGAGQFCAIHATFLTDDGSAKVPLEQMPNRKLMLGQVKGGFVPLSFGPGNLSVGAACEQGVSMPVILAEGIETGLAVAQAVPEARVWACLSLGNLGHAPVHFACISEVVVATENDTKPQALRQRDVVFAQLEACGKPVRPMVPTGGNDFADVMQGSGDVR